MLVSQIFCMYLPWYGWWALSEATVKKHTRSLAFMASYTICPICSIVQCLDGDSPMHGLSTCALQHQVALEVAF